jgi:enoyl-CoA hydratase
MTPQILIKQDGPLLRIVFNRPDDNGISDEMAAAFAEAVNAAHQTSDAVLVSSSGPDFCTARVRGPGLPPAEAEAYARRPEYDAIFNSYKAIRHAQVPVVGVFRGRVMGYGMAIAALCDVSFASESATFSIPEIAHKVMPTMVMAAVYDRMNRNAALWMAYSAEFIDAQRALTYGLVSTVVPEDRLVAETERFCQLLLSRPRPALLGLKEYTHVAPQMSELGAIDYARSLHSMVNTSAAIKQTRG